MARRNADEHLNKEQVKLKKYFYVLRPLLAMRYVDAGGTIPPVSFLALMDLVAPASIKEATAELLALKRVTSELGKGARVAVLDRFVAEELARYGDRFRGQGRPDVHEGAQIRLKLNEVFRKAVRGGGDLG